MKDGYKIHEVLDVEVGDLIKIGDRIFMYTGVNLFKSCDKKIKKLSSEEYQDCVRIIQCIYKDSVTSDESRKSIIEKIYELKRIVGVE
jgi:hypothetical protein